MIKRTHENYKALISIISSCISYLHYPKNNILFKIGDKGDKFFIILKGQVSVLITKEYNLEMSEEEYFDYIKRLITNDELYMLNNCIKANNSIYPFIRDEILNGKSRNSKESFYVNNIKNINLENKIKF